MKVVPFSLFILSIKSIMFSPVAESRFAVGSSANTIRGSVTNALAIATLCFWPPLNSSGR